MSSASHPVAVPAKDAESSTLVSTSAFLSNLFDPSVVDPSLTGRPVDPGSYAHSSSSSTATTVHNRSVLVEDSSDGGTNDSGGGSGDDLEYEHDIYFVLVIVTVALTLFILFTFTVYRVIDTCMQGQTCRLNRQQQQEAQQQHQQRQQQQQHVQAQSQVIETSAGSGPGPGRPRHGSSLNELPSADQPPYRRYTSVEILTNFLTTGTFSRPTPTTVLPSSAMSSHGPPNLRPPRSKRHRDAPPPYDDPPPYHIAISMPSTILSGDSSLSSDVDTSKDEAEEDFGGSSSSERGSAYAVNSIGSRRQARIVV